MELSPFDTKPKQWNLYEALHLCRIAEGRNYPT